MRSLLSKAVWTWNDFFNGKDGQGGFGNLDEGTREILGKAFNIISIILWVVLGIVGAIGAVYAIFLGVQLARAEDQGKRDDAKKHLITVVIAIGVTIALILVFNTLLPALISAFVEEDSFKIDDPPAQPAQSLIQPWLSLIKAHL